MDSSLENELIKFNDYWTRSSMEMPNNDVNNEILNLWKWFNNKS